MATYPVINKETGEQKEVVEELESEIYSDIEAYQSVPVGDYEEVFEDDDGYPD